MLFRSAAMEQGHDFGRRNGNGNDDCILDHSLLSGVDEEINTTFFDAKDVKYMKGKRPMFHYNFYEFLVDQGEKGDTGERTGTCNFDRYT